MKLSGSWKEIGWIPGFDLFELSPSLSNTGPRIDRDHEEQGHRGKRSKIMNDPRQRTFQNNTSHSPLQPSPCWGAPAGLILSIEWHFDPRKVPSGSGFGKNMKIA